MRFIFWGKPWFVAVPGDPGARGPRGRQGRAINNKTESFMKKTCVMIGAAFLGCAARAELIAYEPFQYRDGNGESLIGGGTGTGWDGKWVAGAPSWYTGSSYALFTRHLNPVFDFHYADTNGLALPCKGKTYASLSVSSPGFDGAWEGFYASRAFAQTNAVQVGDSIWISLLALQNSSAAATSARNYIQLETVGGQNWSVIGCPADSSALEELQWGIINYYGKESYHFAPSPILSSGQPMFLVVRVTMTSASACSISLWVNPLDMSSVASLGTPYVSTPNNPSSGLFTGVMFHTDRRRTFSFDEIRVGTELRDVTRSDPLGPTRLIVK